MYGRIPEAGAPPCPHVFRRYSNNEQIPEIFGTQCELCTAPWFLYDRETGEPRVPYGFPCENHALCRTCVEVWRGSSLSYCPWQCYDDLLIQPDACELCRDWRDARREDHPDVHPATKRIVELRQDMADDLDVELNELTQDSKYFRIPKAVRGKLMQYWRTQLYDFDGQYHNWWDLAEILDPMRGSDIDPLEAFQTFEVLLQPFPKAAERGHLAPDRNLAAQFPDNHEPWITTFLRTTCHNWDASEGKVVEGRIIAVERQRHARNPEQYRDWSGDPMIDWPIARIVEHQIVNGDMWYRLRFLGSTAAEDVWKWPIDIKRQNVFRVYNRENDVEFDEEWLMDWRMYGEPGTHEPVEQPVQIEEVEEVEESEQSEEVEDSQEDSDSTHDESDIDGKSLNQSSDESEEDESDGRDQSEQSASPSDSVASEYEDSDTEMLDSD